MKDIIMGNASSSLAFIVGGNTIKEYLIALAILIMGMLPFEILSRSGSIGSLQIYFEVGSSNGFGLIIILPPKLNLLILF
ncbi:hypothetical protein KJ973_02670 [Patescibacteria group bacterium]|nr:hypothetical protein [Patescibacteria group bacterium]MBU1519567.1 hypothetical protein [Patescibacteria group bacterium]MBU2417042.1 hypothetical protein [Patescibacteria group bacterium]MBU2460608.1 hypothetical protein [Patescibacteria group bacterium]